MSFGIINLGNQYLQPGDIVKVSKDYIDSYKSNTVIFLDADKNIEIQVNALKSKFLVYSVDCGKIMLSPVVGNKSNHKRVEGIKIYASDGDFEKLYSVDVDKVERLY